MTITRISAALALVAALAQTSGVVAQQAASQRTPPPQTPPAAQPTQTAQPTPSDQPPIFRAGINFVRVDVIITDKKGEPVGDLTAADFQVVEDNKPQTIEQFKLVRVDSRQKPGDEPLRDIRTSYDEEREASRDDVRLFVIFFDDYHTRDIGAMKVRAPLAKFIQTQLSPKDLVAFMYPLSPLDTVIFTRDPAKMLSAVDHFEGRKYKYEPRNQFEEQYAHYPTEQVEEIRNQVVIGALRGLATHVGAMREGRKSILYVGEGLSTGLPPSMRNADALAPIEQTTRPDSSREETVSFFNYSELLQRLRDVFDAANRSNASIYTIDPRGLATNEFGIDEVVSPDRDRQLLSQTQDLLRTMAEETDGRAIVNRNDLAKGLEQMVRDSSAYYLLGYNSTQAPADGKFHEIKVTLSQRARSRGLQVRSRKGYLAPTADDVKRSITPSKPTAPKPVEQALASMVNPGNRNQYVRSWVGLSRGAGGKTRLTYVWEPLPAVSGVRRDAPGQVSLLAASLSGDLLFRGKTARPAAAAGTPASAAAPATKPVDAAAARSGSVSFDLPPGKVELRISVEGESGGVLDREVREIIVPNLAGGGALSTPRVFRARTPRDVQALLRDAAAMPMVGREFSRAERVLIRFDAYGSAEPSAALLNRDGQKMVDVPVAPAAAGGTHQVDLALGAFPAGEYVIEISAGDAKELVAIKVGS